MRPPQQLEMPIGIIHLRVHGVSVKTYSSKVDRVKSPDTLMAGLRYSLL